MSLNYDLSSESYEIAELPVNYDWVPIRDIEYSGSKYGALKDNFVFDLNSLDNDFVDLSRMQLRGKLKILTANLSGTQFVSTDTVNFDLMDELQVNAPLRAFVRSNLMIDRFRETINDPNEVYNYHLFCDHNPKYVSQMKDLTGVPLPLANKPKTATHQAPADTGYLVANSRNATDLDYIDVPFVIPLANLHKSLRLVEASRGMPVQLELQTQRDGGRVFLTKANIEITSYAITELELWVPRILMPEINEARLERTIATSNSALKAYGMSQHYVSPLISTNSYTFNLSPQKNRVVKAIVYLTDQVPVTATDRNHADLERRVNSTGSITHLVLRHNNIEVQNQAYHFTTTGDKFRMYDALLQSHGDHAPDPESEFPLSYGAWDGEQKFYVFDCHARDNDQLNNMSVKVELDANPSANMHVILVTENELRISSDEDSRMLAENTAGQSLKY